MTKQEFVHLHNHTDASLRDGLGTVDRLLDHAKALGFDSVAMTDHGTLSNAVAFTIGAKARGLRPLLGMEGYVEYDGEIGHITLLANGNEGWHSLVQLNNLAQASPHRSPAFRVDDLVKYNEGIICLTGCVSSPLQQLGISDAMRLGYRLKSAFGPRLFAELMFVGDSLAWERPLELASRLNLKQVITNDVHFPIKSDATIHPLLVKMKSGYSYDSSELYLKTRQEMLTAGRRFGLDDDHINDALTRTYKLAHLLQEVKLEAEPVLPTTHGMGKLESLFARPLATDYRDRSDYEIQVIKDMGYEDYFLILNDIIQFARGRGIMVGPGRGSGAGSLILYLLGITGIDPIAHGLQFERFLNPERRGMPDVDVDIDSERRDEVIEYAAKKYGAVPIATFSRYSHKSLIRDLGKMFRLPPDVVNALADSDDKSDIFADTVSVYPEFGHAYEALLGQTRHKGKHAGGIIITDTDVPLERVSGTLVAGWSEGKEQDLSYAGIVKYDFLGLSALSALSRLEKLTGKVVRGGTPADNDLVFEVFQKGDLAGVFQFAGSDGIRTLTMDVKPTRFEDLVAINALYRPGAIDAGTMEKYVDWRKAGGRFGVPYIFGDVLAPTYGAIIYQEQFMEIYRRAVNGTLGEADTARRVIAKGQRKTHDPAWRKKFLELHDRFTEGLVNNHGFDWDDAEEWWKELATHVGYSFNKSHAAAYALIAYQTAWYKYWFPVTFYATMLNVDPEQQQTYILEATKSGIRVLPPNVNASTHEWVADEPNGVIYMPLSSVKGMGPSGVSAILAERGVGGEFVSVENFMARVPKRMVRAPTREALWLLHGFEGIPHPVADDECAKLLGLKATPKRLPWMQAQMKYMGFVVPNKRMLDWMREREDEGYVTGMVDRLDNRTSKYGPYTVYWLKPRGVFWSRDTKNLLGVGDVIAVMIDDSNGKATDIRQLM